MDHSTIDRVRLKLQKYTQNFWKWATTLERLRNPAETQFMHADVCIALYRFVIACQARKSIASVAAAIRKHVILP